MYCRRISGRKIEMKKLIYFFFSLKYFFIVLFATLNAQEYPTDRLFMKHFNKVKCLQSVEERVNNLKTKREMTLEHELLLNKNIWYKIRTKLPLSPGEMKRLRNIQENGISSNKLSSKKLWAMKEKKFKVLRSKCK